MTEAAAAESGEVMENAESRVATIAAEIQDLAPTIAELTQRVRAIMAEPQITTLEGRERAETLLPCEIGAEALGRCQILVANNVVVLETLGVISLTRYVFELLVWLRTIQATPLKSLRFLILSLKDGEDHTSQHIAHLEAEAQFLDVIAERDDPIPGMMALQEEHGENLTAEIVRNAEKARMDVIDFEARRHFIAYAADAKVNGNAPSTIDKIQISQDGVIYAQYADGTTKPLYKIPLADVQSPDNLTAMPGNVYAQSTDSGAVRIGFANEGRLGSIVSGALENSNVDIAEELTNMIAAQRSYTANSKVFQTGSDLMDVLVNLKR